MNIIKELNDENMRGAIPIIIRWLWTKRKQIQREPEQLLRSARVTVIKELLEDFGEES